MKEMYTKPVSQVEEFQAMDVMTTSGWTGGIEQGDGGEL